MGEREIKFEIRNSKFEMREILNSEFGIRNEENKNTLG